VSASNPTPSELPGFKQSIMKTSIATFLCSGLALLTGCISRPKITSDFVEGTDFPHYKSFAVMERVGMATGIDAGPVLTAKVREAVTQALSGKGFIPTDQAKADFLVMVQGRLNAHVDISNYGYGLPPGRPWRYGGEAGPGWDNPMWGTDVIVSNSGRLAVDVIDRRSKELIWRGIARKDYVSDQPDPDRITTVVGLILKGFPPSSLKPSK
jgi:hypothetical protein